MEDKVSDYPPLEWQKNIAVVREAPPDWRLPNTTRYDSGVTSTEELKGRYTNEWLAIEVSNRDGVGTPMAGRLVAHGSDADTVWGRIAGRAGQFYVFYTGEILQDMAVIFNG